MSDAGDHNALNRRFWNAASDEYQERHGSDLAETARAWGVWRIPESRVQALGEVEGRDLLELGCGAAQWSLALASEGARVVALDLSERQLVHARGSARDLGVGLRLTQASAERLPFAEESFDCVFCDHGAMSFTDPQRTVPEVRRVLRPGGRFSFCMSTPIRDLADDPATGLPQARFARPYFGLDRLEAEGEVCFQLPYGGWIDLFGRCGLEIERLVELRPPADAATTYDDYVSLDWARRWPTDHVWILRRS